MEHNGYNLLASLTDSAAYREFQSAFTEALRLPLALRPVESWQLPLRGVAHENRFCALMARSGRACATCLQMQQRLAQRARQGPATVTCWCGLTVSAVPVRLNGQVVGLLETGQVFRTPPTESKFAHCARVMATLEVKASRDVMRRAYFSGPVVSPARYRSIVEIASVFAAHLGLIAEQIAVQRENAEPPLIRRAKEFIHEHHAEGLGLTVVSQAINSSPFYFCKIFRKATGINFTEYVSRVRIEKAKNLLLNPDVEVSEIAYAVGFQSLTHFNRVFKKVLGQSPTEYRAQLLAH
jgi:AraC-like DNA-binding protein